MEIIKIQNPKSKIQNCDKRVCAILPAYNEEKNIVGVIKGVRRNNIDIVVIDDGSTDETYQTAKETGVIVIRHPKRKGKGMAVRDGLHWALDRGYDYMVTIDSDGQHDPCEISLFIDEADRDNKAGIVIGSRLANPGKMPLIRFYTNKIMSYFVSALCKQFIPDTQCGYKLLKKEVLELINIKSRKFEIESELLVKAANAGFGINSIPIKSIYAGEKSKINPFTDAVRFVRFLIKEIAEKV